MWTHIDSWVKQQTDSLHLLRMKGSQSCFSYSGYCSSDYAFELGAERKQDSAICDLLRFTGEILLTVPLNKASCVVFVLISSLHLQGMFLNCIF